MHTYWQCKRVFQLFSAGERLGSPLEHFQVTRSAKGSACDGDGQAKQGNKGKGEKNVGYFQMTPLSIMQSACKPSNLASCFAVIAPP
jgi:hypothetical protein